MSAVRRHRGLAPFVVLGLFLTGILGGCGGGGTTGAPPEPPAGQLPTSIAPTDPASVERDAKTGLRAASDEVVCYLRDPVPREIARIEAKIGGRLVGRIPATEELQFRLTTGTGLANVVRRVEELREDPGVIAASPNFVAGPQQYYPNDGTDVGFGHLDWDIEQPQGQNWGWEYTRVPLAWEHTKGKPTVRVGIVDTGFLSGHEDLRASIEDAQSIGGAVPDLEHGTAVAGVVGAVGNNEKGIAGVSYGCRLRCYWLGEEWMDAQAREAVSLALEEGCKVINYSAGVAYDHVPGGEEDESWRRWGEEEWFPVLDDLLEAHGLLVQAVGNGVYRPGHSIHGTPFDASWHWPARLEPEFDSYVTVAACAEDGQLASFSNRGSCVTIAAPGVNICSCDPYKGYKPGLGGTSVAAPFVTGLIGLLFSIDADLPPAQIKALIEEGATARGRRPSGESFYIMDAWESARRIGGGGEVIISGWLRPR